MAQDEHEDVRFDLRGLVRTKVYACVCMCIPHIVFYATNCIEIVDIPHVK